MSACASRPWGDLLCYSRSRPPADSRSETGVVVTWTAGQDSRTRRRLGCSVARRLWCQSLPWEEGRGTLVSALSDRDGKEAAAGGAEYRAREPCIRHTRWTVWDVQQYGMSVLSVGWPAGPV